MEQAIERMILLVGWLGMYAVVTRTWLRLSCRLASRLGMRRENYTGRVIPVSGGLFVWAGLLNSIWIWGLMVEWIWQPSPAWSEVAWSEVLALCVALSVVFAIGWLDDAVGDRLTKGFRGHVSVLFREHRFTTGFLKIIGMSAAVLILLMMLIGEEESLFSLGILFLLWVLTINGFNLLDVRPGRSVKGWLGSALLVLPFLQWNLTLVVLLVPLIWMLVIWSPLDLRRKAMLGDSGANLIGFMMGYVLVTSCPAWLQGGWLIMWIVLHWIAERSSISRLIEQHDWLRRLDQWGGIQKQNR
ncbi:hypothetical protein [Marinicrinis sediminis]|uniref:Glycosyl transferase family 4 n=1 Tax=Marinicrinis sediminis TaxID=1652465 RepID=A0ABW5RCN3_9BACL